MRHLPPTAAPLSLTDLGSSLAVFSQARPRFQAALGHYLGTSVVGLAASARTAFYLLLKSLATTADSANRREVLLPAYTCPSLVKVITDAGLQPHLIDIATRDFRFCRDQVAAALSKRTLAVVVVHPWGIPQAVEPVLELAHAAGAVVIEDAAQALGARLGGQPVGTRGDFGLFSLGPGKPLPTGGGGFVTVRHPNSPQAAALAEAWEKLAQPSVVGSAVSLLRLALFGLVLHPVGWWAATKINLHKVGEQRSAWSYRLAGLTDAQSGVGARLLRRLDQINARRRRNAERIVAELSDVAFVQLPCVADRAEPIYLRLPLLVDSEARRERLFGRLWAAGIGVGRMYEQTLAGYFPELAVKPFPGADALATRLLTLPTHHHLTQSDISTISRIFKAE